MESANSPNLILMGYKIFPGNEGILLNLIADTFSVRLAEERRSDILRQVFLKENATRANALDGFKEYDSESQIHGDHISNSGWPGAWLEFFSTSIADKVTQELGDVMYQLGYLNNS